MGELRLAHFSRWGFHCPMPRSTLASMTKRKPIAAQPSRPSPPAEVLASLTSEQLATNKAVLCPFTVGITASGQRVPMWTESGIAVLRASRTMPSNNIQAGERFGAPLSQVDALISSNSATPCPSAIAELADEGTNAPIEVETDNPVGPPFSLGDAVAAGIVDSRAPGGDES